MSVFSGDIPPVPKLNEFRNSIPEWAYALQNYIEMYMGGMLERERNIEDATGVVSHSNLLDLTVKADHTEYLVCDGSRPLTGKWSVGNQDISNIANLHAGGATALEGTVDISGPCQVDGNFLCASYGQFSGLGVGATPATNIGAYIVETGTGGTNFGLFGRGTSTKWSGPITVSVGNIYGLDFAAAYYPSSTLQSNATVTLLQGVRPNLMVTTQNSETKNCTITGAIGVSPVINYTRGTGSSGSLSNTNCYEFATVQPTLTNGATIGTLYGFYDTGLTNATTNYGLAINTAESFVMGLDVSRILHCYSSAGVDGSSYFVKAVDVSKMLTCSSGIAFASVCDCVGLVQTAERPSEAGGSDTKVLSEKATYNQISADISGVLYLGPECCTNSTFDNSTMWGYTNSANWDLTTASGETKMKLTVASVVAHAVYQDISAGMGSNSLMQITLDFSMPANRWANVQLSKAGQLSAAGAVVYTSKQIKSDGTNVIINMATPNIGILNVDTDLSCYVGLAFYNGIQAGDVYRVNSISAKRIHLLGDTAY